MALIVAKISGVNRATQSQKEINEEETFVKQLNFVAIDSEANTVTKAVVVTKIMKISEEYGQQHYQMHHLENSGPKENAISNCQCGFCYSS